MKKLYLLISAALLSGGSLLAQCTETNVDRVLLIGDSWAAMMNTDNTFNTSFATWGHTKYKFYTNATLAENGTETTDFIQQARLDEIQTQLLAHPTIDFVHISLGGNDVLGEWHKTWPQAKTDSLLNAVSIRLTTIMDFIKSVRPDIKIVWSGYAYPNFGEIIGEMAPFQTTHPFYATWNGMGQPTFAQINGVLNYYSDAMEVMAANDPQLTFVRAPGLMQYAFGQLVNLSVPPSGNYPALTAPLPGGFPDYPSPKTAMRNYVVFRDCFHLSADGFSEFIRYQTQKYYQKALMDDQYFISEGGSKDGSVSSVGTVSASLNVGSISGEDFSTVLTFNTTTMPDTGVSAASIFIRRASITGTNPIGANLQVKVISGNFGATVDVEAADYSDPGNANGNPCQFGTATANGGWVRLELPAAIWPFISQNANTQFVISAPGATGSATFTDASDPDFAPVLNIKYGINTSGINSHPIASAEVNTYPNPTNGMVVIKSEGTTISRIEIIDLPGKVVMTAVIHNNTFDMSTLPSGMYLVRLYNEAGDSVVKRIVRK
jgi:lysophospholipase L1-like esterase